mmetsp:Transcript_48639/g.121769  ORF Transcript_48639/g.121769 Transcript_48639/m.121769 type:complete len:147 (-) Transcript_48639:181-621(-)
MVCLMPVCISVNHPTVCCCDLRGLIVDTQRERSDRQTDRQTDINHSHTHTNGSIRGFVPSPALSLSLAIDPHTLTHTPANEQTDAVRTHTRRGKERERGDFIPQCNHLINQAISRRGRRHRITSHAPCTAPSVHPISHPPCRRTDF